MKLSVPTNWQNDLIENIKRENVGDLYGKLANDFVGGGRPSSILPFVSKKQAKMHIQQIHKNGMKFNYLLNAACLDNREFTISGQKLLNNLLDWLENIEVDCITVANPYLLQLIKKRYKQFEVYVSSFADIDSIEAAKYWEGLGADQITLASLKINRNFQLLREIRRNVKCGLQLIANQACLYNCPLNSYHKNTNSHQSQSFHHPRGIGMNYCVLSCRFRMVANPAELICSPWIRPEDIHYYEGIGIDKIKLQDRSWSKEALLLVVNAYINRNYDGNLLDLLSAWKSLYEFSLWKKLKYFLNSFSTNIFRLRKAAKLVHKLSANIYIDNRALDGFLEYFCRTGDCFLKSCRECGYCCEIAKRVIRINLENQHKILNEYKDVLNDLTSSKMFSYK